MSDGSGPVPGWYADPQDSERLRWWDGAGWTSHVQAKPPAAVPTPASAGAPFSPGTTYTPDVPADPTSSFPGVAAYGAAGSYAGPDFGSDLYGLDDADDESRHRRRLIIVVVVALLAALALMGLLFLLLNRNSGAQPAPPPPTAAGAETNAEADGAADAAAAAGGACASLLQVMTANDMPIEISVRLQELSNNQNAAANSAYFANINTQLQPSRDSYQQACLDDINAGSEPATVRSFVTAFDSAVQTGLNVGAAIAAAGSVDPAQQQALTQAATQLEQANAALPAGSVSQSSLVGEAVSPQQGAGTTTPAPAPTTSVPAGTSAAGASAVDTLSSGALVAPLPAATVDPFAAGSPAATTDPYAVDPYSTTDPLGTAGTTSPEGVYDPYVYSVPTTPAATPPPADSALAAADNAADATKQSVTPTPAK